MQRWILIVKAACRDIDRSDGAAVLVDGRVVDREDDVADAKARARREAERLERLDLDAGARVVVDDGDQRTRCMLRSSRS